MSLLPAVVVLQHLFRPGDVLLHVQEQRSPLFERVVAPAVRGLALRGQHALQPPHVQRLGALSKRVHEHFGGAHVVAVRGFHLPVGDGQGIGVGNGGVHGDDRHAVAIFRLADQVERASRLDQRPSNGAVVHRTGALLVLHPPEVHRAPTSSLTEAPRRTRPSLSISRSSGSPAAYRSRKRPSGRVIGASVRPSRVNTASCRSIATASVASATSLVSTTKSTSRSLSGRASPRAALPKRRADSTCASSPCCSTPSRSTSRRIENRWDSAANSAWRGAIR